MCLEQGSLLSLALHDDLEELLAINVLLLHENGGSLVQDLDVALNKVLCPPAGGRERASAGWWLCTDAEQCRMSEFY